MGGRSKIRYLFWALVIGAGVVAVAVWQPGSVRHASMPAQDTPQDSATPLAPVPPSEDLASLTPEQQRLLANPETLEFVKHLEFQQDVRQFFREADNLPAEERKRQADQIRHRLAEYEQSKQVSGPEALMVQIAMARLELPDEEAQKAAVNELVDRYRAESEARHQAWLNQPKPEFDAYKEKEKQIVDEVMSMERIPDDMDRNEYLRQRLLEARIEAENGGGAR